MRHVSDAEVDAVVDAAAAQQAMLEAYSSLGAGQGAMQSRVRTEASGIKLSTLGAVLPALGWAGAKVYTTVEGRFNFVIVLFDAASGRPLASFDAAAITRLRTAACSVVAGRHLARPEASVLGLLGAGVQGRAHAQQFASAWPLREILVCSPNANAQRLDHLAEACGVPVRACDAQELVETSALVVTASRAKTPLFSGEALQPGTFVAAIGSSLPSTRELDDTALTRATCIAVDWSAQALQETGDLALAAPEALAGKVVDLAELVTGKAQGRQDPHEIHVYKSVGVGLQDVALAGLAWSRLQS